MSLPSLLPLIAGVLLSPQAAPGWGDTLSVAGRITAESGSLSIGRPRAVLQTARGGFIVRGDSAIPLLVEGDSVVATGVLDDTTGIAGIEVLRLTRVAAPRRRVVPRDVGLEEEALLEARGLLVRIEGVVLRLQRRRGDARLWVAGAADSSRIVLVEAAEPVADAARFERFAVGDVVSVTGVLSYRAGREGEPGHLLRVRGPADASVVGLGKNLVRRIEIGALIAVVSVLLLLVVLRRQARETVRRLAQAEGQLQATYELAAEAVLVCDGAGRVLACNPAGAALLGESREALTGRPAAELIELDLWARLAQGGEEALAEGPIDRETVLVDAAGERIPVAVRVTAIEFFDERRLVAVIRDRREQVRTEAELRSVFAAMDDVVLVLSHEGRYLKIPPTNASLLYRPPSLLLGRLVHEVLPSAAADEILGVVRRALQERGPVRTEYSLEIGGEPVWFAATVSPLDAGSVVWVARNVTAERRAQIAVVDSEQRYRLLFDRNPTPMWVFDRETLAFLMVNDAAVEHYGFTRDEFLGMTLLDIRPPEERTAFESLRDETGQVGVFRHRTKAGLVIDVEITTDRIVFDGRDAELVLAVDVTGQRRMEEQMRQVQKMEAVGQLAAGIAHDFNNLLTVIQTHAEFLVPVVPLEGDGYEDLVEIRKATTRAAALTRQLLAYSRKQILRPLTFDLNEKVLDLESMLMRLIGEHITIHTDLRDEPCGVLADPHQIEQVIVNLAVNARDAMPGGGRLYMRTEVVSLAEQEVSRGEAVAPGDYVLLTVTDTGEGMTPEVMERIFEPFYTTKPTGQGTGLGLSTVYGVLKQSQGHVYVSSAPGTGTSFRILLPLQALVATGPAETSPDRLLGRETVLLVEDEEPVRRVTRRILEKRGYTVIEAANGREALERATEFPGQIHLLLSDAVMPELGGGQLWEALRQIRPEMRAIFMSGYTDDEIIRAGVLASDVALIDKPFTIEVLLARVRGALDGVADAPGMEEERRTPAA